MDQASLLLHKQLKGGGGVHSLDPQPRLWSALLDPRIMHHLAHHDATELTKNPVEGFSAGLVDDSNIFEWQVTIMGPPDTF